MKKLPIAFSLFFTLISTAATSVMAENLPEPNQQQVGHATMEPQLTKQTQTQSSGPTSEYYPEALGVGEPTGEGAQNQPAPNQQTTQEPAVTNSQAAILQPSLTLDSLTLDSATTNAPSDQPPPLPPVPNMHSATVPETQIGVPISDLSASPAPPAINTQGSSSASSSGAQNSPPVMPQPPTAPTQAAPDHSDAPAAAQLPAGVTPPAPPNPEVSKMKVSAQKNLDAEGHSVGQQIHACWKIPKSSIGSGPLTAVIYIDKSGVLTFSEFTTTPTDKQGELATSIKTAIAQCSPLKSLPPESKYEEWKSILLKFNPNRHKAAPRKPAEQPQQ